MTRTSLNKAIEAAEHPILLENPAQLASAEASWSRERILGIDTEFVRERTYRARLGLVQVSDGHTAWLVDPLRIDSLDALARMLTDPGTTKILHSGSEDLEVLYHGIGAIPEPIVDSQVACALLGQDLQMGYHAAVNWLFGIDVDKDQTRTNWCRRPLSTRQLHYAAMDVVLLPEMLAVLRPRLEKLGRWQWLEEEAARARRNARREVNPDEAYLRIGAAARLDDESLRVLKSLAAWRERRAMKRDLARGFVVNDTALVQMAREKPASAAALRDVEGVHPRALERHAGTWLKLIRKAASQDGPLVRPNSLDGSQHKQVKQMRALVMKKAAELDIDPAMLASRRELENLVHAVAEGKKLPERFVGWRKSVIGDDLVKIYSGDKR